MAKTIGIWARRLRPGRLAAAGLLLGLSAAGLFPLADAWRADARLRAAREAAGSRDYPAARAAAERALDLRPNSFDAHLLLARISRQAGYVDEAEVRLDACELLEGATPAVRLERALLAVQRGDLTVNWDLPAYARDHPADAAAVFEALARGYRANYLLGPVVRCTDEWLSYEPGCAPALLLRGWARERQGDLVSAAADYRLAVAADPGLLEAGLSLGRVLLTLEKPLEALPVYEALHAARPEELGPALGLAQALRQAGRAKEALDALGDWPARRGAEAGLLLEEGRIRIDLGEPAAAESSLRRAVVLAPGDYQAQYALMRALSQQGKSAEVEAVGTALRAAESTLKRMADLTTDLQARPLDPDLRCEIGKLFLQTGELAEAERWLRAVLRTHPNHRPTLRALENISAAAPPG